MAHKLGRTAAHHFVGGPITLGTREKNGGVDSGSNPAQHRNMLAQRNKTKIVYERQKRTRENQEGTCGAVDVKRKVSVRVDKIAWWCIVSCSERSKNN